MADLKKVQPNQWPDFTPPRSAQCRRSTGWFCHRHAHPPVEPTLFVTLHLNGRVPLRNSELDDAIWSIERWGVQRISVVGHSREHISEQGKTTARALADFAVEQLAKSGISAAAAPEPSGIDPDEFAVVDGVEFDIIKKPESRLLTSPP